MINKLLSLSILLLWFFPTRSQAQISLQTGYGIYKFKSSGFEKFFDSYNSMNASNASELFKEDFSNATGFGWRIGYVYAKEEFGLYMNAATGSSTYRTSNTFTFINNSKRELALKVNDWSTDLSIGIGNTYFHIAPVVGFYLRSNTAYMGYIYTDGTKSYGLEKLMNGIFTATRFSGAYGAEVGAGMKYVNIIFKAVRSYKPFGYDGSPERQDYYKDLTDYKNYNPNGAGSPSSYIPENIPFFLTDQLASESANNFVHLNDHGWHYSIGLQFNLLFNND